MAENCVLNKQVKACGHVCYPSSTLNCCACMDQRPVLQGDCYPNYVDGEGWQDNASRDAHYCPVCNPKNFDEWVQKLRIQSEEKAILATQLQQQQEKAQEIADKDRQRAAKMDGVVSFTYSNNDIYEGDLCNGLRHGQGKMLYANGDAYDGQWLLDKHHGHGTKNWGDGIIYTGDWKDGMMHGKGIYTMADGTVVEGEFIEDEFAGY